MKKFDLSLSVAGLALALVGVGALFGLFAHGYDASSVPAVFIVQSMLAVIICGVYFAWQHGTVILCSLRADYLRRSFPNQPWLWRLDWSRRISKAPTTTKNIAAWVATTWNLFITPIAITGVYQFTSRDIFFLISGLCIAVGAALFLYALYRIWYRTHLDNPPLRLHTNPARPGGTFECTLGASGFSQSIRWTSELVCLCTRTETIKIDARYTTKTIVEEHWKRIVAPLVARSPRGTALAIKFTIPQDALASGANQTGYCRWVVRIEGRAANKTIQFRREYEIPIHGGAQNVVRPKSVKAPTPVPANINTAPATLSAASTSGLQLVDKRPDQKLDWSAVAERDDPVTTYSRQAQHQKPTTNLPAMLDTLKATGILFTAGGVIYPDKLWNQVPLIRLHAQINTLCTDIMLGSLALVAVIGAIAPWYCTIPFVLSMVSAGGCYALAFYIRHHRYSVIFGKEGVTRRSQLFKHRWQKTIPWHQIQSIVCQTRVACGDTNVSTLKQLVINPDHRSTRLALSPAISSSKATDALMHLFDVIARKRK